MLLAIVAAVTISVAITTFFLIYEPKDNKKEVNENDASVKSGEKSKNERFNNRNVVKNEKVKHMSPIPVAQVVFHDREHKLQSLRKNKNQKLINR